MSAPAKAFSRRVPSRAGPAGGWMRGQAAGCAGRFPAAWRRGPGI